MNNNTAFDVLIEIAVLACAALFLTDTPERIQIANQLMEQVKELAQRASKEVDHA